MAGSWQAIAFTSARCTGVKRGGRPDRGRSLRPSSRSVANRPRHLRTVSTFNPSRVAITAFGRPAAASRTILALITMRCGIEELFAQVVSRFRSEADRRRTTARAEGMGGSSLTDDRPDLLSMPTKRASRRQARR